MIDTFLNGGVVMWPMTATLIGVIWLTLRAAVRLRNGDADLDAVEHETQAILFWGVISLVLGVLGTVLGVVIMTQAVVLANAVEPALVWGGVGVAAVSLIFGLTIFLLSSVCWFLLNRWAVRVA